MNQYHNDELEQAILGAVIIEPQSLSDALGVINSDDIFYSFKNKNIFSAIRKLYHAGADIDLLTVVEEYNKHHSKDFEERRAASIYINHCANSIGSSAHVENHCYIIKEMYIRRKVLEICLRNMEQCKQSDKDVFDIYEKLLTDLDGLNIEINRSHGKSFSETTHEVIEDLRRAANDKTYLTGMKTGLYEVDRITGGWQDTDLIILAARPAMGKTAYTLDTARKQAKEFGKRIAYFSLEMSQKQLTQRVLSQDTQIDFDKIRKGGLQKHEWRKLDELTPYIADLPLFVCDKGGLTINEICSISKNWKAKHKIDAIYVDYLQNVTTQGKKGGNREQEVSEISRRLKQLAKELHVPVIALAQLSRACEGRDDKRPMLSDLRESGGIEQDADVVMFLYRDAYYTKDPNDNSVEIIFAKNRNGKTGTVIARADLSTQRFLNADYAPDTTDYSQSNKEQYAGNDGTPF